MFSLSGMGLLQTPELASTLDTVTGCIRLQFLFFFFVIFLHRSSWGCLQKSLFLKRKLCRSPKVFPVPWGVGSAQSGKQILVKPSSVWLAGCLVRVSAWPVMSQLRAPWFTGSLCIHSPERTVFFCSQSKNITCVCHFNGYTFYLHIFVHSTQALLE